MTHSVAPMSRAPRALVLLLALSLAAGFMMPPAPAAASSAGGASLQDSGVTATVTGSLVNLRGGPGTGYAVVGRATEGENLAAVGRNAENTWLQVNVKGKLGWVSSQLVKAAGAVSGLPVVQVAPPPKRAAKAPAAPRSTAAAGFFGYGIQVDPGDVQGSVAGAADLGMQWVKWQLVWKDFESAPGQRNWPDDLVNAFNAANIKLMASIVKAPDWARSPNTDMAHQGPPADPNTYASFVGEFAARYCGRVQAIEVWNEQNLYYEWGAEKLDANRYMNILKAAYRAIKGACPSMIVVSGAPTPTGAPPPIAIRDTTYLEQMYRAGLKNFSDAIGVHPSGFGNPPDARVQDWQAGNYSRPSHVNDSSFYFRNTMEQYRNIMVKYGDSNKRLWPTEFGWASSGNPQPGYEYALYNSEQQQGEYIVRAYEMMRSWGWVGVAFLWQLNYNNGELAAFRINGRPAYGYVKGISKQ